MISEQKPNPPLKLMTEPVKLLDENLELNTAALEFLHDSSTNYLVVGIIGNCILNVYLRLYHYTDNGTGLACVCGESHEGDLWLSQFDSWWITMYIALYLTQLKMHL